MFCKNCGNEVPADVKFCASCGQLADHAAQTEGAADTAPAPAATQTAKAVVPNPGTAAAHSLTSILPKPIIKIAVGVVAAVLVIILLANLFSPSSYIRLKGAVHIEQMEDDVIVFTAGNKQEKVGGYLGSEQSSLDGTKAAFTASDDDEYDLYYVDGKVTKVDSDVYTYILSLNGDAIAYLKDYERGTADLYLSKGGKKGEKIASEIDAYSDFCLSPDGKAVGYSKESGDGGDTKGFLWNGKEKELGKNRTPQYVSAGGKYVYVEDKSGALCVQKGDKSDTSVKLGENYSIEAFNSDLTQILYSTPGKMYISSKGGEKKSISGSYAYFLMPGGTAATTYGSATVYGFGSFANKVYYNGNLYRMNGRFDTNRFVQNVSNPVLAKDGKTVYFVDDDQVFKANSTKSNPKPAAYVKEDTSGFVFTNGDKRMYCYEDRDWYVRKGVSKLELVAESPDDYEMLLKSGKFFYLDSKELYVADGKKGKVLKEFGDLSDCVSNIYSDGFTLYVTCYDDGEYSYFRSTNGSKFEEYPKK